jgi:hypothetical protein
MKPMTPAVMNGACGSNFHSSPPIAAAVVYERALHAGVGVRLNLAD